MNHTDVFELKSIPRRKGKKYFITFIDDNTKYCYVYLLKSNDEAIQKFIAYKMKLMINLNGKSRLFIVKEPVNMSYILLNFVHKMALDMNSVHLTQPKSNETIELKNRTLKDMVNAMLVSSGVRQ
ncbi:uncharacterized protein [Rutidosis leptorrhynchoides]|uniref:uncharacterized protein n=1 Tax=Rutidosis leptorrhynchoides TaxID=125765 RepID=UPI003A99A7FC